MTVSSTNAVSGPYVANGSTTVFPFTFKAMTSAEVRVTIINGDTETEQSPSLYTTTLSVSGGSVTFDTAPATGNVYIYSEPLYTQETGFSSGQQFSPSVLNDALDRATVRDQDLKRRISDTTARALMVPVGEVAGALPPSAERVGMYLAFDAGGDPVASSGTGADAGLRTDLAAEGGASLIRYDPPWAGAIGRTIQEKLDNGICDLADFGVREDVSNNSGGIQDAVDAISASSSTGAQILIPAGRIIIQDRIVATNRTIALVGHGESVSVIVADGELAGFDFLVGTQTGEDDTRRLNLRDFTIEKIYEPTGGDDASSAIYYDGAYTGINAHIDRFRAENFAVRAKTAAAVWGDGLILSDVGGAYLNAVKLGNIGDNGGTGSRATGAALRIQRVHSANCNRFHVVNSYMHRFQSGVMIDQSTATQAGSIEGLYFTGGENVGCNTAILCPEGATPASDYVNGLQVANYHMDVHDHALLAHRIAALKWMAVDINKAENGGTAGNSDIVEVTGRLDTAQFAGVKMIKDPALTGIVANGIKAPGGADVVKVQVVGCVFENMGTAMYCASAPTLAGRDIFLSAACQLINCGTEYGTGVATGEGISISGRGSYTSGQTVPFGVTFASAPVVVPVHEGTNPAVNVTAVPSTESFIIYHNAGAATDIAWTAGGAGGPVMAAPDLTAAAGAGLVGYDSGETYGTATVGGALRRLGMHVKEFGAVGDCVTNDTAAVVAAIAAAKAAACWLQWGDVGDIYAVDEITITSGHYWRNNGAVVKARDGLNQDIFKGSNVTDCIFEDMLVDGDAPVTTSRVGTYGQGWHILKGSNIVMRRSKAWGCLENGHRIIGLDGFDLDIESFNCKHNGNYISGHADGTPMQNGTITRMVGYDNATDGNCIELTCDNIDIRHLAGWDNGNDHSLYAGGGDMIVYGDGAMQPTNLRIWNMVGNGGYGGSFYFVNCGLVDVFNAKSLNAGAAGGGTDPAHKTFGHGIAVYHSSATGTEMMHVRFHSISVDTPRRAGIFVSKGPASDDNLRIEFLGGGVIRNANEIGGTTDADYPDGVHVDTTNHLLIAPGLHVFDDRTVQKMRRPATIASSCDDPVIDASLFEDGTAGGVNIASVTAIVTRRDTTGRMQRSYGATGTAAIGAFHDLFVPGTGGVDTKLRNSNVTLKHEVDAATAYIGTQTDHDMLFQRYNVEIARLDTDRLAMAKPLGLKSYAFASLPAPASGDVAMITDSSTPTKGATIAGGGANIVVGVYDGSNWVVL